MRIEEAPLSADKVRILKVLRQEIPTWHPDYAWPRVLAFLFSLFAVAATALGGRFLFAFFRETELPPNWPLWTLLVAWPLALLVGWLAPRPDFRMKGGRKKESPVAGCLGAFLMVYGGALVDGLVFFARGARLRPEELEIGATLVTACLANPGMDRGRIVKAVAKNSATATAADVERVLKELNAQGIIGGNAVLRVPPGRLRDFGASEVY